MKEMLTKLTTQSLLPTLCCSSLQTCIIVDFATKVNLSEKFSMTVKLCDLFGLEKANGNCVLPIWRPLNLTDPNFSNSLFIEQ